MGKGSKSSCGEASHQLLKDKAKNRVEDLHLMFIDLQLARKESRVHDVAVLEEQVNQVLHEWKIELNEQTPTSSLREDSLGSFSSELSRLLKQFDEEDDVTSPLEGAATLKDVSDTHALPMGDSAAFTEEYQWSPAQLDEFQGFHQWNDFAVTDNNTTVNFEASNLQNMTPNSLEVNNTQSEYLQLDMYPELNDESFIYPNKIEHSGADPASDIPVLLPNINIPPSAYLGPKCALWDCSRPVHGSKWCEDYCGPPHATLAMIEGPRGVAPLMRPGGIYLKDNLLFMALRAKLLGKVVGIPECEGAATAKCPWNAPESFDISILKGETVREWLFFDKPQRAYESGTRKQRSLPDYRGRGWHESRKQFVKELGGLKRSYYMDPQPVNNYEWHLFEYEIDNDNGCALYRLELKATDGKKSPKGKVPNDSLADLQKRMGRLTAEVGTEKKSSAKGKARSKTEAVTGGVLFAPSGSTNIHDTATCLK